MENKKYKNNELQVAMFTDGVAVIKDEEIVFQVRGENIPKEGFLGALIKATPSEYISCTDDSEDDRIIFEWINENVELGEE